MAYQIAPLSMTLNDFQGYSPIASLFQCDLSYSYGVVNKISADIARRAAPLPLSTILLVSLAQQRTAFR